MVIGICGWLWAAALFYFGFSEWLSRSNTSGFADAEPALIFGLIGLGIAQGLAWIIKGFAKPC